MTVKLPTVSAIAELAEERVVEGVYAVARKQRLRTKNGAPYLALELVDPSGRIDARLLDDTPGDGEAAPQPARVPSPRLGVAERHRTNVRAHLRADLPPIRRGAVARACPPRAAARRGTRGRVRDGRPRRAAARDRSAPRCACCPHCRAGRALPREPARRGRRNASCT